LLDTSAPARYQEFEPEPQPRIRPFSVPWRRPLAGPLPPKSSISRAQPIPSKTICGMCASQTSGTELLTNPRCQWRPQVVCFVAGTAREFLGPARYKSGLARSTNLCYRPPLWSMRLHLRCLEKTGPHHLPSSLVAPTTSKSNNSFCRVLSSLLRHCHIFPRPKTPVASASAAAAAVCLRLLALVHIDRLQHHRVGTQLELRRSGKSVASLTGWKGSDDRERGSAGCVRSATCARARRRCSSARPTRPRCAGHATRR
jgi:hypothetical protein